MGSCSARHFDEDGNGEEMEDLMQERSKEEEKTRNLGLLRSVEVGGDDINAVAKSMRWSRFGVEKIVDKAVESVDAPRG